MEDPFEAHLQDEEKGMDGDDNGRHDIGIHPTRRSDVKQEEDQNNDSTTDEEEQFAVQYEAEVEDEKDNGSDERMHTDHQPQRHGTDSHCHHAPTLTAHPSSSHHHHGMMKPRQHAAHLSLDVSNHDEEEKEVTEHESMQHRNIRHGHRHLPPPHLSSPSSSSPSSSSSSSSSHRLHHSRTPHFARRQPDSPSLSSLLGSNDNLGNHPRRHQHHHRHHRPTSPSASTTSTPHSAHRRHHRPDSPSLSSLLSSETHPDQPRDPTKDPLGRHHAREMNIATFTHHHEHDGHSDRHHDDARMQHGRLLDEMERILELNGGRSTTGTRGPLRGDDPLNDLPSESDPLLDASILQPPIHPAPIPDLDIDPAIDDGLLFDDDEADLQRYQNVATSILANRRDKGRGKSKRRPSAALQELDAFAEQIDSLHEVDPILPPRAPPSPTSDLQPPPTPPSPSQQTHSQSHFPVNQLRQKSPRLHDPSDVFGSIDVGMTPVAFDVHSTRQCVLCSDRVASMYCLDCRMPLCTDGKGHGAADKHDDDSPRTPELDLSTSNDDGDDVEERRGRREAGCLEMIHREFTGHRYVTIEQWKAMKEEEEQESTVSQSRESTARSRVTERRDGEYETSLMLVEPSDALELPPPVPPSPPRFLALDSYLRTTDRLDVLSAQQLALVQGVCAICQHCQANVWCETCGLALCSRKKRKTKDSEDEAENDDDDAGKNEASDDDDGDDSTNPDCDHALHRDHHAHRVRVPFDASIHKREYGTSMPYSDAAATAKLMRGYVTGSPVSPPPSLPPSNQPSPRLSISAIMKPNPPPGSFNEVTGSFGPTCDVCSAAEAQVYCANCDMYLCVSNGCDEDVHAAEYDMGMEHRHMARHQRIDLADKEGVIMVSPIPSPHVTPTPTPRDDDAGHPTPRSARGSRSCDRCLRHRATLVCDKCDMRFCHECDETWHEDEESFRQHQRHPIEEDEEDADSDRHSTRAHRSHRSRKTARTAEEKEQLRADQAQRRLDTARQDAEDARRIRSETSELERKMAERRRRDAMLDAAWEDSDDDVARILRQQREHARHLNVVDTAATPRTIKRRVLDENAFDPCSVQPTPMCAECKEKQADVYCWGCKKFLCAHALNYFDLRQKPRAAELMRNDGVASPPQTSRHYNNCFLRLHNLPALRAQRQSLHRCTDLPHHAAEKSRRREEVMRKREQERLRQQEEARQLQQQAEEARRKVEEEEDAHLRAVRERRLQHIQEEQRRLEERQRMLDAQREQHRKALAEARRRALEEARRDHEQWLEVAKQSIREMDKDSSKVNKEFQVELKREQERFRRLIQRREEMLQLAEQKRMRAWSEELRLKRAIRDENLCKQRIWLEQKAQEEKTWRTRLTHQLIKKAIQARQATNRALEQEGQLDEALEREASIIAQTESSLLAHKVHMKEVTNSRLNAVSEALRRRKADLAALARDRAREEKEAERRRREEELEEEAERSRRKREAKEAERIEEEEREHEDRMAELRERAKLERRKKEDALHMSNKVERIAEKSEKRIEETRRELEQQRAKLTELRRKSKAREAAAKKQQQQKAAQRRNKLGRIAEENQSVDGSMDLSSRAPTTPSSFHSQLTRSSIRVRTQRPKSTNTQPKRRQPVRSTTAKPSSSSSSNTTSAIGSARTNSSSVTAPSWMTDSMSSFTDAPSSRTADVTPSVLTASQALDSSRSSEQGFVVQSIADSAYDSEDVSFHPTEDDEDETSFSADSFLDSIPPTSPRGRKKKRSARPDAHSPTHSSSSFDILATSHDMSADDLSIARDITSSQNSLRPAPTASSLLRTSSRTGSKLDQGKFSLDQLAWRDEKGKLVDERVVEKDRVKKQQDEEERNRDLHQKHRHRSRSRERDDADAAALHAAEQLALRLSFPSNMSHHHQRHVDSLPDDDSSSDAVTFRSCYTDDSAPTHRSGAISCISGMEGEDLGDEYAEFDERSHHHHHVSKWSARDAAAGVIPSSCSDLRAMRHATSRAHRAQQSRAHSLAHQLFDHLTFLSFLSSPILTVFRRLVERWLDGTQPIQPRQTELVARAFRVVLGKVIAKEKEQQQQRQKQQQEHTPTEEKDEKATTEQDQQQAAELHPPQQQRSDHEVTPHALHLATLWRALLHARLSRSGSASSRGLDSLHLGHPRTPHSSDDDEWTEPNSARMDGETNLLQQRDISQLKLQRRTMRAEMTHEDDDVMGPTRSVVGELDSSRSDVAWHDALRRQQRHAAIGHHRHHHDPASIQQREGQHLLRRADRLQKEHPYSDAEDEPLRDGEDDDEDGSWVDEGESYVHDGDDGGSTIVTSTTASTCDIQSYASTELGMNPFMRAQEDRMMRREARTRSGHDYHGHAPPAPTHTTHRHSHDHRKTAWMDETIVSSSSSDDDDNLSDYSSIVAAYAANSTSTSIQLPRASADASSLRDEHAWYIKFHSSAMKKDEAMARKQQESYERKRKQLLLQQQEEAAANNATVGGTSVTAPAQTHGHVHAGTVATGSSISNAIRPFDAQPQRDELSQLRNPSNYDEITRMSNTLSGEVGALQCAAGLTAQAHPLTFLPHELRQHEARMGSIAATASASASASIPAVTRTYTAPASISSASRSSSSTDPAIRAAAKFDQILSQQMLINEQLDAINESQKRIASASKAISMRPAAAARAQSHKLPVRSSSRPSSQTALHATSSTRTKGSDRVRATLKKAQKVLADDLAVAGHGAAMHVKRHGGNRSASDSPPAPLPAAGHIDPSLAYLQQLRRRDIHEKSASTGH